MNGQRTRRVATYERVSSDSQRERATILTQYEELKRRLEAEADVEVVERYVDDGVSGATELRERPDGARLLYDAEAGRFDELWVYKLDRLGRDDIDPLVVRRDLLTWGVKVVSLGENIDSPLAYGLQVLLAAEERRVFLQRSADGMNRAAREGRYFGGIVPYGYRVEGRKQHARLIPDDTIVWGDRSAADVVRWLYRLLAGDGWSCVRIADELNALAIPTAYTRDGRGIRGKRTQGFWRPSRIRNLVVNPVYRGELQFGRRSKKPNREVISGPVPALVSQETWDAARAALARNDPIPDRTKHHVYMLRSLIRCGICGLNYCGAPGRDTSWYRCNGQMPWKGRFEGRCPAKSLKGTVLESLVWSDIERFLRDPGNLIAELAAECLPDASEDAVAEADRITLQAALADLEVQRAKAIQQNLRGRITDEEFDEIADGIARQRSAIESRLSLLSPAPAAPAPLPRDLLDELHRRLDEGLTAAEQREIAALLVKQLTVYTTIAEDGRKSVRIVVEYRFDGVVETHTGIRADRDYTGAKRVVVLA